MQNHQGSQRRRAARRQNKPAARELLLTDTGALRAARERAMVETAPMANMPTDKWERELWGFSDE